MGAVGMALVTLSLVLGADVALSSYDRSLVLVLRHEGGFVNHPADPGGATNKGVTQRVYDAWRRSREAQRRSVIHITAEEVAEIYKGQYWDHIRADELPAGLDYAVFDYAVNSGPSRAVKDLQRILNVPADGRIGVVTLGAARDADVARTINRLCDTRMGFLRRLGIFKHFGKGWTRRVTGVRAEALAIHTAATAVTKVSGPSL